MANAINWFEIPAANFERAKKFYETIFAIEMAPQDMGPVKMAFFPYEPGTEGVSGALCTGEQYKPSADGAKLYLNGGDDLSAVLNRVAAAGGKVAMPKTQITPEYGYMAFFVDTEGNVVGLHSAK